MPLNKVFSDIINAHEEMTIMAIVALVASFTSAFVIHYIAHVASWLILVVISVLLVCKLIVCFFNFIHLTLIVVIVLTSIFWWAYIDTRYRLDTLNFQQRFALILPEDFENEDILLTISILCTLLTLVILYAAASLRTHVRFVVALFHETSSCIRSMPMLLLQPLWTLFSLITFIMFWLATMMALSTAEHASKEHRLLQPTQSDLTTGPASIIKTSLQLSSFTLITYKHLSWIHYMWWYLVIALIWLSEFILSCQQIVIAGAVSKWYFTRDRERDLDSPIYNSIKDLLFRHIGSVALGSFLITCFKLPRLIIQQVSLACCFTVEFILCLQVTTRLRQYDESRLARGALQACGCCLWVVERFLSYLSRNAYTVVAIEKVDFCTGARLAFQSLMSNALKVAAINSIGDFILFLGKLIVAVLTALVGVFLIRVSCL